METRCKRLCDSQQRGLWKLSTLYTLCCQHGIYQACRKGENGGRTCVNHTLPRLSAQSLAISIELWILTSVGWGEQLWQKFPFSRLTYSGGIWTFLRIQLHSGWAECTTIMLLSGRKAFSVHGESSLQKNVTDMEPKFLYLFLYPWLWTYSINIMLLWACQGTVVCPKLFKAENYLYCLHHIYSICLI